MELQRRYGDIQRQGLGLAVITYDPIETLKAFSDSRGIAFPLLSDPQSAIIRRFGLLNESVDPKTRAWGIPHPGTFVLDRQGRVDSRFFEDAYQERYTAAAMLAALGADGAASSSTPLRTDHLTVAMGISDAMASPGHRLAITADVTPAARMHVYAPGRHDYQVVRLTVDPQTWMRVNDTVYPPSEIYHFVPLDERIEVYSHPFRLRRDVTLLATPEAQKELASRPSVTISGALEYQACNDMVCFNPTRVPFRFAVTITPLDRRPPG